MATQVTATANADSGSSFVRIAIALQTLTIFLQGRRYLLYVLAAVPAWKPGGGSPRPIWHASGFLALASVQVVLGIARVPSVHLPLGVLMFGLSVPTPARR